jgi:hypothetical protein
MPQLQLKQRSIIPDFLPCCVWPLSLATPAGQAANTSKYLSGTLLIQLHMHMHVQALANCRVATSAASWLTTCIGTHRHQVSVQAPTAASYGTTAACARSSNSMLDIPGECSHQTRSPQSKHCLGSRKSLAAWHLGPHAQTAAQEGHHQHPLVTATHQQKAGRR